MIDEAFVPFDIWGGAGKDTADAANVVNVGSSPTRPSIKVYACGPMGGLSSKDADAWRQELKALCGPAVIILSPMRGVPNVDNISPSYEANLIFHHKGVTARDRFDVQQCDIMVANLIGMTREKGSVGSIMEYGWANAYGKVIVTIAPQQEAAWGPNFLVADHPMIKTVTDYRVASIADAAKVVLAYLP